jgi:hypothetical protein
MSGLDWLVWNWCVGIGLWPQASPAKQQPENQPAEAESDCDQRGAGEG